MFDPQTAEKFNFMKGNAPGADKFKGLPMGPDGKTPDVKKGV